MPRISPEAPTAAPVITSEEPSEPVAPETLAPTKADRPFLVYVQDSSGSRDKFDTIEKVLLQDERVAYGSRAFTAVRMSPEEAAADPLLAKSGKATPRFIVVSADYSTVSSIEGSSLTATSVWNAMKSANDKFFTKTLDSCVREMKETVLELGKMEGERAVLETKKSRLAAKGSEREQKAVEAKLVDLDARTQKVMERQRAIWELKAKTA